MSESILAVTAAVVGRRHGPVAACCRSARCCVTRSSRDVSVPYFGVLNVGFLLWFMYGLASSNLTVALPNVVAFTVGTITIVTALRLRRATPRPVRPPAAAVPADAGTTALSRPLDEPDRVSRFHRLLSAGRSESWPLRASRETAPGRGRARRGACSTCGRRGGPRRGGAAR